MKFRVEMKPNEVADELLDVTAYKCSGCKAAFFFHPSLVPATETEAKLDFCPNCGAQVQQP